MGLTYVEAPGPRAAQCGEKCTATQGGTDFLGQYPDIGTLTAGHIDGQAVQDHLDDVDAMLLQAELDLRTRRAVHAAESESVAQRARAARANLEKARLDLRTLEVKSSIDRELLKLAAEEAQSDWQEAQRALTLVADRQQVLREQAAAKR